MSLLPALGVMMQAGLRIFCDGNTANVTLVYGGKLHKKRQRNGKSAPGTAYVGARRW